MMVSRRATLAAVGGVLLTGMLQRPARAQALRKLVVGDIAKTAISWPLSIADTEGMFADEKVSVDYIYAGSNAQTVQQLVGRSTDLAVTTMETLIRAVENGAAIAMVSSGMLKYPYSFMAPPSIAKPSDLKGKKAILDLPKSFLSYTFKRWMTANGLAPDDVDLVYDGASTNRFAALAGGVVVVAPLTQPFDMLAMERGYHKLIELTSYPQARTFGFTALAARRDWVDGNADVLRAYLRAEARAIDWLYDPKNRDQAIKSLIEFAKTEPAVAQKTYDYYATLRPYVRGAALPDEYVRANGDYLIAGGDLKAPFTLAKYVDKRFLPRI
jgi:ABC-type nitrate/sulfonate/bicarbonate transport system substrate-binding protein